MEGKLPRLIFRSLWTECLQVLSFIQFIYLVNVSTSVNLKSPVYGHDQDTRETVCTQNSQFELNHGTLLLPHNKQGWSLNTWAARGLSVWNLLVLQEPV